MSVLKFLSDGIIMDVGVALEGHRVQLTFDQPITTINKLVSSGFQELNEHNHLLMSDFSKHKHLYHEDMEHHVFTITDDPADTWIEQETVSESSSPLEEAKE